MRVTVYRSLMVKRLRIVNCCQLLFVGDNVTTRLHLMRDDNPVETMTSPGCARESKLIIKPIKAKRNLNSLSDVNILYLKA